MRSPRGGILGLLVALAACGSPAPAPSDGASPVGSAPPVAQETCDPNSQPLLLGPDGDQVQLGEGPGGTSTWLGDDGLTYYLRQTGDCVWITGVLPAERVGLRDPVLTSFFGRLDPGFEIIGQFSDITGVLIPGYDRGPWTYLVTFDDGDVVLVEDRTDGDPPGCGAGGGACPPPRSLRRLEDLQVASDGFDPPFTIALPPGWEQDGNAFFNEAGPVSIELHRDPTLMAADCSLQQQPRVGPRAADIVGTLAARDGLVVTGPVVVSRGALSGLAIDFSLDPDWTVGCPWNFGQPVVPVFGAWNEAGGNTALVVTEQGESWRFIVLDAPDGGTILIYVVATDDGGPEAIDLAMPVVESIDFGLTD